MHYGVVNEYLEPVISLNVLGTGNASLVVDFVIDTGCTEEIILPQQIIVQLNLIRGADVTVTLADGTSNRHARYPAQIEWHGQLREIAVISMGTEPLIGMELLRGSNLSVDAIPGGSVTTAELSGQP